MKLISWNVNGLRSVQKRGFMEWFTREKADVVCLQEIKVKPEQIEDEKLLHPNKYESLWYSAEKPGYSGVAIYTKREPTDVRRGLKNPLFDGEGRWLEADFNLGGDKLTVINSYFPNSQRDHARLDFKLDFCKAAEKRLLALQNKGRSILLCGDLNIAHKEIDLKNAKSNRDNAGFLPEERAWMEHMLTDNGWLDTFRLFEPGPGHYTWWSYRPGVREKNVGWRLDYFLSNPEFKERLRRTEHCPDVIGSDHCPVRIVLKK